MKINYSYPGEDLGFSTRLILDVEKAENGFVLRGSSLSDFGAGSQYGSYKMAPQRVAQTKEDLHSEIRKYFKVYAGKLIEALDKEFK